MDLVNRFEDDPRFAAAMSRPLSVVDDIDALLLIALADEYVPDHQRIAEQRAAALQARNVSREALIRVRAYGAALALGIKPAHHVGWDVEARIKRVLDWADRADGAGGSAGSGGTGGGVGVDGRSGGGFGGSGRSRGAGRTDLPN
jgi:hypothetical protein